MADVGSRFIDGKLPSWVIISLPVDVTNLLGIPLIGWEGGDNAVDWFKLFLSCARSIKLPVEALLVLQQYEYFVSR